MTEPGVLIFNAAIQWNSLIFEVNKTCNLKIAHKINEEGWKIDIPQKS